MVLLKYPKSMQLTRSISIMILIYLSEKGKQFLYFIKIEAFKMSVSLYAHDIYTTCIVYCTCGLIAMLTANFFNFNLHGFSASVLHVHVYFFGCKYRIIFNCNQWFHSVRRRKRPRPDADQNKPSVIQLKHASRPKHQSII